MANFNKKISETSVRVGPVRFCYAHVFAPKKNDDGTNGKYGVQLLIPKTDKAALTLIENAINAAKQAGVSSKWNGKMPPASKLKIPLRDGDEEFPDDDTYAGMYFMNTSSPTQPGVRVLENGMMSEALDEDDFYSGCYGCATVSFGAYNISGTGVGAYINNVIKTADGKKFSGGHSAEEDFADLVEQAGSCLD